MEFQGYHLVVAFACGVLLWPLIKILIKKAIRSKRASVDDGSQIYGLDHGILNLKQPITMWMNVGYWKNQMDDPHDFPAACKALLEVVLNIAFRNQAEEDSTSRTVCLLDVGFGCGDQSLHLLGLDRESTDKPNTTNLRSGSPTIRTYVGITNNASQCSYARKRIKSSQLVTEAHKSASPDQPRCELFCEDASEPFKWSLSLKRSLQEMRDHAKASKDTDCWLLALDTMYHFSPSRLPLLRYARCELDASFMALDYMLADGDQAPTWAQSRLLRIICLLLSAPYSNFLTPKEYKQMLVKAGYREEDTEIQDISEYVFGPLSTFMAKKDDQLRSIGLGIGAFHVARWVFSWWASSGIVKACVVVARSEQRRSRPV